MLTARNGLHACIGMPTLPQPAACRARACMCWKRAERGSMSSQAPASLSSRMLAGVTVLTLRSGTAAAAAGR